MRYTHLRNATGLLEFGDRAVLIDPMLSSPGDLPGFTMFGPGKRPNPLVPLPDGWGAALDRATDVLVTHTHADHLDAPASAWIASRGLPVWTSAPHLRAVAKLGLDVREVAADSFGVPVETVPGTHGYGFVGWMMGPVDGFVLAPAGEAVVYLTGDTVLTRAVRETIDRVRPDWVIAPAGCANFGAGRDILFPLDELVELVGLSDARTLFNHVEALDHCPTTRAVLVKLMEGAGFADRVRVPKDGEAVTLVRTDRDGAATLHNRPRRRARFQKWLSSKLG